MRKYFSLVIILSFSFFAFNKAIAQNLNDPGDYMSAFTAINSEMNASYMAYVSQAAHGHRARKLEKMREKVLETITNSRYKASGLPIFKGDNSLRKGCLDYMQVCYNVFNDDYKKLVNIEEIAEQSFDEMELYLLLQEKTSEKLHEAYTTMDSAYNMFAKKNNVKIIESKNELSQKMEEASGLRNYHDKVYLLFFKCNWQDGKLTEALNSKKINDVEQARNSLIRYATEGLSVLDTLKSYKSDPSLAMACRRALQFYKKEAEQDIPKQTEYLLKNENFEKIKKSFNAKSPNQRTKEEVDAYNKAVKEINNAVAVSNEAGNKNNEGRNQVIDNWNEAEKNFNDAHTPYYKK